MKTFLNLRLSARLGAAFGFLVLALVVTAVVGLSGLGKVNDQAEQLSSRDVAGLEELVTVSEDFLASGYLLVRHLYVEDGDLKAQDATAKEIDAFDSGGPQDRRRHRPAPRGRRGASARSPSSSAACATSRRRSAKAIELSRQETVDGVEERDGSRGVYTDEVATDFAAARRLP